ncbi:hypothetical protein QW060_20080 [Myroides ceti]|uniref:Uncharacterized protein n=1 Tax=Paenimyroides ceti TaxID=395087 RepID=A0ABT8CXP0_9FLAO|nr:hypothetical protein [Paenimyroides ceti]MDN3709318.1 hypothetical protein [Paenimyroides ceti]
MTRLKNRIQVFEHNKLIIGRQYDGVLFSKKHYDALFKLNELHNDKYFRPLPEVFISNNM